VLFSRARGTLIVDMGLLTQTATPAKEVLGVETIAVVADRGYFKIEDIEACEQAGIEPYVPRPQRGPSVKAGLFRKDEPPERVAEVVLRHGPVERHALAGPFLKRVAVGSYGRIKCNLIAGLLTDDGEHQAEGVVQAGALRGGHQSWISQQSLEACSNRLQASGKIMPTLFSGWCDL
jgi:hypothetical protein